MIKISSSPGGKHPKAIIALNKTTGEVISEQGVIPEVFTHYILKYDDDSAYPTAKLEYVYTRMAVDAGVDMMPSELRTYECVTHFLTERFDRRGNDKIHVQTLAAMSPTSDSYENIFAVIRRHILPYEDHKQQFLRMVFNAIARNVDDHSKNFSFCMHQSGAWRLSPAYANRHSLTINGKSEGLSRHDLEAVGRNNDIQDYGTLIDKVVQAINNFEQYSLEAGVDMSLIKIIQNDFMKSG